VTDVVLAGACRTPVGKYGRAFRNVEAVKLGSTAIAEAVNRTGLVPADIEEVIMGNVSPRASARTRRAKPRCPPASPIASAP